MNERVLHCWAAGPARTEGEWPELRVIGSTCLREAGHDGGHEWTPDDQIVVQFLPADAADADRKPIELPAEGPGLPGRVPPAGGGLRT